MELELILGEDVIDSLESVQRKGMRPLTFPELAYAIAHNQSDIISKLKWDNMSAPGPFIEPGTNSLVAGGKTKDNRYVVIYDHRPIFNPLIIPQHLKMAKDSPGTGCVWINDKEIKNLIKLSEDGEKNILIFDNELLNKLEEERTKKFFETGKPYGRIHNVIENPDNKYLFKDIKIAEDYYKKLEELFYSSKRKDSKILFGNMDGEKTVIDNAQIYSFGGVAHLLQFGFGAYGFWNGKWDSVSFAPGYKSMNKSLIREKSKRMIDEYSEGDLRWFFGYSLKEIEDMKRPKCRMNPVCFVGTKIK